MTDEQMIPLSVLRSYSPHPDKLDLTGLTQEEITHGIKSSKLPDYIRYKQYLTDTNEALAQLAEMIIQFAVNLSLDPDQTLDWARKLQQALPQSEFDSWVATLLDGGPSIFMNTLSELQTTYPNGAAGVALVRETDPAKIYVWNGTSWEDFGDYQGIEIKDGAVTTPKISDGAIKRSKIGFSTRKIINATDNAYIAIDTSLKTITLKGGTAYYYFTDDGSIVINTVDMTTSYSSNFNKTFGVYYNTVSKVLKMGNADAMSQDDIFICSIWTSATGTINKISSDLSTSKFKVDGIEYDKPVEPTRYNFLTSISSLEVETVAKTLTLKDGFWFYETGFVISSGDKTLNYGEAIGASGGTIYLYYNVTSQAFNYYKTPESDNLTKDDIFIANVWFSTNGETVRKISSLLPDDTFKINGEVYNEVEVFEPETYDMADHRLVVSPEIYITEEETLPIYKSSILPVYSDVVKLSLKSTNGNKATIKSFEYIDVDAAYLGATGKIVAKAKDVENKFYSTDFSVNKVSISAKTSATPKILMIGDSITNRQLPNYLKLKLADYGITSTMLGTMINEGGERGEGREGWLTSTFTGRSSKRIGIPAKVSLQSAQGTSSITLNPFIRLATEVDKTNFPDRCFRMSTTETYTEKSYEEDTDKTGDFYIFDFANYMTVQGIETPDIITIALGTNDISALGSNAINNAKENFDIMLDSIRTILPNVKIGIIPQPQAGDTVRWRDSVVPFIEAIIKYVSDRADDNLFIVPVWMHQNREFIFNTTATSVGVGESNEMVETVGDNIHFGTDGRYQYTDVLFAFVANKI
ncbi:hypothetical protein NUITMVRA1_14260 [Aerococcus viridans]|uniref:SGNH/GDSL hydrolase family protein n=1 Tax=Aerococcus viridans TaxID=1377 RepID=UPI0028FD202A|nr:hypothetical protein NUITMVRA1_14260 [Aerococcus viridans]